MSVDFDAIKRLDARWRDPFSGPTRTESALNITREETWALAVYKRLSKRQELKEFADIEGADGRPISSGEKIRDEEFVRRFDGQHALSGDVRGELLEDLLLVEMERADWFGGSVFRTTRYDDVANGVDAVIEWDAEEGETHPRLAVDLTAASRPDVLREKIGRSLSGAGVKYFTSEFETDEEGDPESFSLVGVPLVILAVDRRRVPELAHHAALHKKKEDVTEHIAGGTRLASVDTVIKRAFEDHPLKQELLRQASMQLDVQTVWHGKRLMESLRKLPGFSQADRDVLHELQCAGQDSDAIERALSRMPFEKLKGRVDAASFDGFVRRILARQKVYEQLEQISGKLTSWSSPTLAPVLSQIAS